jgi:hypothetical protein
MVYVKDPRERVVPSGPWALMPSIITLLPEDVPEIADFISAENAAPIVGLQTIGSLPFLITNISNFVTLNLASKSKLQRLTYSLKYFLLCFLELMERGLESF